MQLVHSVQFYFRWRRGLRSSTNSISSITSISSTSFIPSILHFSWRRCVMGPTSSFSSFRQCLQIWRRRSLTSLVRQAGYASELIALERDFLGWVIFGSPAALRSWSMPGPSAAFSATLVLHPRSRLRVVEPRWSRCLCGHRPRGRGGPHGRGPRQSRSKLVEVSELSLRRVFDGCCDVHHKVPPF